MFDREIKVEAPPELKAHSARKARK
jgi:hypothetical protein